MIIWIVNMNYFAQFYLEQEIRGKKKDLLGRITLMWVQKKEIKKKKRFTNKQNTQTTYKNYHGIYENRTSNQLLRPQNEDEILSSN